MKRKASSRKTERADLMDKKGRKMKKKKKRKEEGWLWVEIIIIGIFAKVFAWIYDEWLSRLLI